MGEAGRCEVSSTVKRDTQKIKNSREKNKKKSPVGVWFCTSLKDSKILKLKQIRKTREICLPLLPGEGGVEEKEGGRG